MKTSSQNKTVKGSYVKSSVFTTKAMVTISLLTALSYVLMLLESPPYIGFLRLEFSDIPAILGAFWFGPAAGILIEFLKNLIKGITASNTMGIGELANFIVSVAYVVPASLLFRKLKGKYKSVFAFGAATISMMIVGFLMNYFVTIPLYARMYGGIDNIVGLASMVPGIKNMFTLILIGITPFNLVKGIFLGIVGHITYEILKKVIR